MFSQALSRIVERLDQAHSAQLLSSYPLIGGFAVSAWDVARATQDIDLAVALGTSEPQALAGPWLEGVRARQKSWTSGTPLMITTQDDDQSQSLLHVEAGTR